MSKITTVDVDFNETIDQFKMKIHINITDKYFFAGKLLGKNMLHMNY